MYAQVVTNYKFVYCYKNYTRTAQKETPTSGRDLIFAALSAPMPAEYHSNSGRKKKNMQHMLTSLI